MNKRLYLLIIGTISLILVIILLRIPTKNTSVDLVPVNNMEKDTEVPSEPISDTKQEVSLLFSKKYNKNIGNIVINIDRETSLHAKGSVNFTDESVGGLWFAVKTPNGWELVFDGNGIVSCDIADGYNFPKDIIPGCVDVLNDNNFVQR